MKGEDPGGIPDRRTAVELDFLTGGGEMGARVRALDWSKTPLGAIATWPQSLKTSVSTLLNSRFPMLVWWGPELVKIYNDAYRPLIGIGQRCTRSLAGNLERHWPHVESGDAARGSDRFRRLAAVTGTRWIRGGVLFQLFL